MKAKTPSVTKSLALSLGIGIAFVLLLFSVSGGNSESPFFVFLWPGAFFAERVGYHAHDLQGLLVYIVGNMAFYVVIAFLFLRLVRARWLARNRRQDAASGPTGTGTML